MNNEEKLLYREQSNTKIRLILWIIGTLAAIVGANYSRFGTLFHLKSALLTWFSGWFMLFGWILLTWYFSTDEKEKLDNRSGIMSLSSNPLLLSDYLITSSLIGLAIHPILLISWIVFVKILLQYLLTGKLNLNIFRTENLTFKFGWYKESDRKLNIREGLRRSSVTAIIALSIVIVELLLRNKAINRTLPIEIETIMFLILFAFIVLKIYLTINRPSTNSNTQ